MRGERLTGRRQRFFLVCSGRSCGAGLSGSQLAIERRASRDAPVPMVLNLWPLGNIYNIWHLDPSKPAGVTSKGAWYFERAHPPSFSRSLSFLHRSISI
eukprot:COSAG04_NODE_23243_length_341_cov_1.070248_1_plen_98_part_01